MGQKEPLKVLRRQWQYLLAFQAAASFLGSGQSRLDAASKPPDLLCSRKSDIKIPLIKFVLGTQEYVKAVHGHLLISLIYRVHHAKCRAG